MSLSAGEILEGYKYTLKISPARRPDAIPVSFLMVIISTFCAVFNASVYGGF